MSKEFTPLEAYNRLCSHLDYDNSDYMHNGNYEEDNEIIENALKDGEKYKTIYPLMKAKLDKVSDDKLKLKQALEIIKEKQVNVEIFIEVIKQFEVKPSSYAKVSLWTITGREEDKKETFETELEFYNRTCLYGSNHLTQEEFDFLKEVLGK